MFSVLAAISTGGLYVPAIYIAFFSPPLFSGCFFLTDPLAGWPILDLSFSIATLIQYPLTEQGHQRLRRALRAPADTLSPLSMTLYHKRQR